MHDPLFFWVSLLIWLFSGLASWRAYVLSPTFEIKGWYEYLLFFLCGPLAWAWFILSKPRG